MDLDQLPARSIAVICTPIEPAHCLHSTDRQTALQAIDSVISCRLMSAEWTVAIASVTNLSISGMAMLKRMGLLVLVAAFQSVIVPDAAATTYAPNFVWQRWKDWTPGTMPGTSIGNPDTDQAGSPVWRVGYLTGQSLGSSDPWYGNQMQLAVWDDAWWGSNVGGVWARNYFGPNVPNNIGANPPIDRYTIWQDLSEHTHSHEYASAVDWVNPVGNGAILNMSGSFHFLWEGHFATGSPAAPVEAVLAQYDASSTSFVTLWSGSFTNPTAGSALGSQSTVTAPITLLGVRADEGDFFRFTFRSTQPESVTPLWIGMRDSMYMRLVSVVPAASTLAQAALGLAWMAGVVLRRRRREAGLVA